MDGNANPSFRDIPHAALRVWPGNPRKTVGDVADLAASIRSVGLAEPLVVRALPAPEEYGHESGGPEGWVVDGHYTHEVIAGQRRYHAAALAGLTDVPCRVVTLDDAAALELALIENSQRVDCDPLDEAESIERLVRDHERSPEEIASRLGRDPRWVRRRRSLLGLCDDAKTEVRGGRLPLGHALALAAIDPTTQAEVLKRFTNRDLPSLKSFTREIFYALHLIGSAPFDTADNTLPGGACGGCSKRDDAQGQLDLFAGASPTEGAHCLDTMCWDRKGDVTWDRTKASAKRRHLTVIEDSSEVLCPDFGGNVFVRHDKPYVAQAPSKEAKPVAVTRTERGRIVELYVKPDAKPARDERDPDERDADEVDDEGNPLEDDSDEEGDYPRRSPTAKRLQARVERFQKLIALVKTPAGLGVVARHALCVQIAEYGDVDLRDAAQAVGVSLPDEEDDQLAMAVPDEAAPILLALALAGGSLWEDTLKRSDNEGATERALRDAMEGKVAPPAPVVDSGNGPELPAPDSTTTTLAVKRGDWLTHRSGLRDTAKAPLHKCWLAEGDNRVATVERGDDVVGKVLAYCADNNVPLRLNGKLVGSELAAPEKPAAKKASKKTAKKGDE